MSLSDWREDTQSWLWTWPALQPHQPPHGLLAVPGIIDRESRLNTNRKQGRIQLSYSISNAYRQHVSRDIEIAVRSRRESLGMGWNRVTHEGTLSSNEKAA